MVKGISRRVVVVKDPDTKLFEEAIFLVREDALRHGVTSGDLLEEARRVASGSIQSGDRRRRRELVSALCGAAATGLLWLICALL